MEREQNNSSDWLADAEVMSEVHVGCDPNLHSHLRTIAISSTKDASSRQEAQSPPTNVDEEKEAAAPKPRRLDLDDHGDIIIPRRKRCSKLVPASGDSIHIHHQHSSRLSDVGLQIWKGALLLCDYILHEMNTTQRFQDAIALELGAGTGVAGLLMARYARLVFITDRGNDVLDNCVRNVVANSRSLKHGEGSVRVRELDWFHPWPPEGCKLSPYGWTDADAEVLGQISVLFAADVIYSPQLTDGLFRLLEKMLPVKSPIVLYLALEKRYNFSLSDLDVVAHGYHHFRSFFAVEGEMSKSRDKLFLGRQIDVDGVVQYVRNYQRGKDLELWEIRRLES